ncbi:MAG: ATP-binding protein [Alphaproteobacteria bacterium]
MAPPRRRSKDSALHALGDAGEGRIKIDVRAVEIDRATARRLNIAPGDHGRISVADDGTGTPADVLPRIFDPFFTTKPTGTGTGLGLTIAHGIVNRHGGAIDVTTEVGRGTVFEVYVPLHRGAEAVEARPAAAVA